MLNHGDYTVISSGGKPHNFKAESAHVSFSGVQTENGTYLVGGHLGRSQTVKAAGTTIVYTHNKNKFKDSITMAGPSNAVLRVMVSLLFLVCFLSGFFT